MKYVPDHDLGEWRVEGTRAVRLTHTDHREEVWRQYAVHIRRADGVVVQLASHSERELAGAEYWSVLHTLHAVQGDDQETP